MQRPYLAFADNKPRASSLLFKMAAEKNAQVMREKTPDERREMQYKLAERRPSPPDVAVTEELCAGVPCEWIEPACARHNKVILYIHGGSWMMGNLKSARPVGAYLAEISSYKVLVAEYRLTPEYPYPAGLEDCFAVYVHLLEQGYPPENIALFGDSAGGNLALALAHKLREAGLGLPCALGLASPVVDFEGSAMWLQKPDLLFVAMPEGELDIFTTYAPPEKWEEPLISPVMGDLSGFPPILIHVGGDEALAVDCAAFAEKAHKQGVQVLTKIWREMFHNFSVVSATLRESRQSMTEMAEFFVKYLD